jgi:hypothetical protein
MLFGNDFLRGPQMFLSRRSFPYRLFALISASTSWNQSRGSGCRYKHNDRWTIKFYYHTLFYFKWILLSFPGENAIHFSSVTLVEWISRYSILIPLLEDSVDLRPPALVQPTPAIVGHEDESFY